MTDEQPLSLAEAAGIVNQKVAEMRAFARLKEAIDAALAAEHGLAAAQLAQKQAEDDLAALTDKLNAYKVSALREAKQVRESTEADIDAARRAAADAIARINADRDAAVEELKQRKATVDGEMVVAQNELAAVRSAITAAKAELADTEASNLALNAKVEQIKASLAAFVTRA